VTADIKYIVRYHPTTIKKVAASLAGVGTLILIPTTWYLAHISLTTTLNYLVLFLAVSAMISLAIGLILLPFRWRQGKIELTDDKLIIDGSYHVSIRLTNMLEVDVRNLKYSRWGLRLDSKTDAVQIKFRTEKEFESFSERLVQLVGQVEKIKLKIST
jgi:hypothetical protein